jgi:hypothetical protein
MWLVDLPDMAWLDGLCKPYQWTHNQHQTYDLATLLSVASVGEHPHGKVISGFKSGAVSASCVGERVVSS